MFNLNMVETTEMIGSIADKWIANSEYLCEVDRLNGDGDHGIGMENGAVAIKKTIDNIDFDKETIGTLYQKAGLAMMDSMGGASGIIFSAIFLEIGKATYFDKELTKVGMTTGLYNSVNKIKKIGGASLGDKTMLDALIPAVNYLESTENFTQAIEGAAKNACEGVQRTKEIPAKFGRAKFLGDRTIGTPDAGAITVFLMFEAMKDYMKGEGK